MSTTLLAADDDFFEDESESSPRPQSDGSVIQSEGLDEQTAEGPSKNEVESPAEQKVESPEVLTELPTLEESPQENAALSQEPDVHNLVEVYGAETPLVEVKQHYTTNTPYKERRERIGWMISFGGENLFMPDYNSLLSANTYEDLFGQDDLTFFQAELGIKYNFKLGGIELSAGYGMGSITDNRIGNDRKLEISKPFLGSALYLDTLFHEPYVVPYFGAQIWKMDIKEDDVTSGVDDAITTDFGFSYKAGLLFQLNWLDSDSARVGYQDNNIQNTYLDVYVTQNTGTQDDNDPDTSTDFNWGAGLKIEF